MTISSEMETRLKKIDILIRNGYKLKTNWKGFLPLLINKEGEKVNIFTNKSSKHELPGFSWIGFLFSPFVATQIRNWNYFIFFGTSSFIFELFLTIIRLSNRGGLDIGFGIGIAYLYAYIFPYQRWLSRKNNKKDIGTIKSIFIGFILMIIVQIPTLIF